MNDVKDSLMNCIFNWNESKSTILHQPMGNGKTLLKEMDFWWNQNSYAKLFMLQTFLNATPDFIPIVITAEKYLLKLQYEVKLF